jgi:glycosyltransferase involved in cell wall biosynthesis
MKVGCVIPARNEEDYIARTVNAIAGQTLEVQPILVVDDQSTDKTEKLAREAGATVVPGPSHEHEARTLRICETINEGLRQLYGQLEYIMIVGADNILPQEWVKTLIGRMQDDPKLVIASGRAREDRTSPMVPRGTRIVDAKWWRSEWTPKGLYRVVYGWEAQLIYYARYLGYHTRQFEDLITIPQRPTGQYVRWVDRGKGMKQIGQNIVQVGLRCLGLSLLQGDLRGASDLLSGYLTFNVEPEPWAVNFHKNLTLERIVALGGLA